MFDGGLGVLDGFHDLEQVVGAVAGGGGLSVGLGRGVVLDAKGRRAAERGARGQIVLAWIGLVGSHGCRISDLKKISGFLG